MSGNTSDDIVDEEDLYATLNISKTATPEEIQTAYRKLSRLYHPDKHVDPEQKKAAEDLFSHIKYAYDVLIDEEKRRIYDVCGIKGLKTSGWEVSLHHKTPREVLAEYENIQRREEEARLLSLTQPKFAFILGLDYTNLFDEYLKTPYEERDPDMSFPIIPEISQLQAMHSLQIGMNQNDTVRADTKVFAKNGRGSGEVSLRWFHHFTSPLLGQNSLETQVNFSDDSSPSLKLTYYTSPFKNITLGIGGSLEYVLQDGSMIPGLHLQSSTHLSDSIIGNLKFGCSRDPHMISEIVWSKSEFFEGSLEMGILPPSFGIGLNCSVNPLYYWEHDRQFGVRGECGLGVSFLEGPSIYMGLSQKVTEYSTVAASISVALYTGVHLKLKLNRGNQRLTIPIRLSEQVDPVAIIYGVAIPAITYFVIRRILYDPWKRREDLNKRREAMVHQAKVQRKRRREAKQAQELMRISYGRVREEERQKNGLIILNALYGYLTVDNSSSAVGDNVYEDEEETERVIDVTIPLQLLVENSRLELPGSDSGQTRYQLQGFYDPCSSLLNVEENLSNHSPIKRLLYVRYLFHDKEHEVTVSDEEHLAIPMQKHQIQ